MPNHFVTQRTESRTHLTDTDYEVKFLVDGGDVTPVLRWLRTVCRLDPVFPEGIVSSIYYDTPALDSLREKVNSDYLKTKVRLRWYGYRGETSRASFLEVKYRIGGRRDKVRVTTPYAGAWFTTVPLHDPVLHQMPQLLQPYGVPHLSGLRPVLLVRYRRYRFIEPLTGARVSLDTDISAPRVNREILAAPHPLPLRTAVFELKSRLSDLPLPLHELTRMGARKSSFSKYCACHDHTMTLFG